MADAPKRVFVEKDQDGNGVVFWSEEVGEILPAGSPFNYVRADIADEHKRQRDRLRVFLGNAVGELQEMVDCAESSGDGNYRWKNSKQAAIDSFTAAIAECEEVETDV